MKGIHKNNRNKLYFFTRLWKKPIILVRKRKIGFASLIETITIAKDGLIVLKHDP
jgi:hypothetical protein